VAVVCGVLGAALGATGCLSDDTSVPVVPGFDAGVLDAGAPVFDASGVVDAPGPGPDAGSDAAPPPDASAPDAAGVSILGVVVGGTSSRSPGYIMTGTAGAAHSPLLRSPSYQLVGGLTVSQQKP
jgi:hypothetical protein